MRGSEHAVKRITEDLTLIIDVTPLRVPPALQNIRYRTVNQYFSCFQASEDAIEEREKILEAAGKLVASSLRNNKEKRMSTPSENNLESITEEKDTKDVMGCGSDMTDTDGIDDSNAPNPSHSSSVLNENLDPSHDRLPVEDNVDEITKSNMDENVCSGEDNNEVASEDKSNNQPHQNAETIQAMTDIDPVSSVPSDHLEHQEFSSSSQSSDDDADNALRNLEGFTPLVDLKFKK